MPKPKAKSKATKRAVAKRPAKKAARTPARPLRAVAPKRKAARSGVDPRVVAAIGFALQDEEAAAARSAQLQPELSPWTALGRVRVSRAR